MGLVLTAYAAGSKKPDDPCTDDSECRRGHCYTKKDDKKVCVDCSPSDIAQYRGQIQHWCKDQPIGCTSVPATEEAPEDYFKSRIDNGEHCIAVRKTENDQCWNGGNSGHSEAVEIVERANTNCYNDWNTRKGNGGIYTCSDSTYSSRASGVDSACTSYDPACSSYAKDGQVVECNKLEDAMKATEKCVESVEHLESDCLQSVSRRREKQFNDAKKAYDNCKEILDYKKDKSLCK